ncbi:MAG: glycosyltransferase family 2 protein [Lachnospiraceae bacterium]|nr:glycosyltransferase family 2 protein [Lachnospiraceae bacterium]
MSLTVLLSAMGLSGLKILDSLSITGNAIVINQCGREAYEEIKEENRTIKYICSKDTGLSRSRNLALKEAIRGRSASEIADNELVIFCDNDVRYLPHYEEKVERAFERHPEADMLVFWIKRPERKKPIFKRERAMGYISSMKIFSPEIACRLSAICRAGLKLDTDFGAGARYSMGEENIFLFDALKRGLRIVYIPLKLAELIDTESTWFKGYNEAFFVNRGAGYYRMTKNFWFLLCLQFALRKRRLYKGEISICRALKAMAGGKHAYCRYRKKKG